MNREHILEQLKNIAGDSNVKLDEKMSLHTTFRIGGPATFFVTPQTQEAVTGLIRLFKKEDISNIFIGNGSNLLVSDEGFDGVVVQLGDSFDEYEIIDNNVDGVCVNVKAGMMMSRLGNELARQGVAGFEFATGIPGTIGGAVRMNAGAYGGEMKDIVLSVTVADREGNIQVIPGEDMEFGYRSSCIDRCGYIVLSAVLALHKGNPEEIVTAIRELSEKRRERQPLEYPSAGSTFKRPEGYFAAKLIEDAGLKGVNIGDAAVSSKHAGFVINRGKATATDVIALTDLIKKEVYDQFKVTLELEVVKVGF
ncbi:MAG: UDP-N-acetylmuramate dehydrogenase [Lachnospira sp.]